MDPALSAFEKVAETQIPSQGMTAAQPDQVSQHLADKFDMLMRADQTDANPTNPTVTSDQITQGPSFEALQYADATNTGQMVASDQITHPPSIAKKMVEGQDALLNKALTELNDLQRAVASGQLSTEDLVSRNITVIQDVSLANMNFQIKTAMAHSTEKSAETLMKNQ